MEILYNSTRNDKKTYHSSHCINVGLSDEGGLFIPNAISKIKFDYKKLLNSNYNEIAKSILSEFFTDFTTEQISTSVDNAYNIDNFDSEKIFDVTFLDNKLAVLELFHGKTLAFKDAALSILPHLMNVAKKNCNDLTDTLILTATSGDTGKAALEGFKDVDGIDVIVFYPYNGVSDLQKMQMLTQEGKNVYAFAVKGNFDDTQTAVKNIFNNSEFKEKLYNDTNRKLSSANSINIGRLVPQIVYYYYTYVELIKNGKIKEDELVNFCVPTGNFGNILAGYYAKLMGLPINKLLCASNDNNILTDFFNTGEYDTNRPFVKTIAPSMDILISSNLERFLYHKLNSCDELVKLMQDLKDNKKYIFENSQILCDEFYANYCSEREIYETIKKVYDKYQYILDTHTATSYNIYEKYVSETNDLTYTVLVSTASPYKFANSVCNSLTSSFDCNDGIAAIDLLNKLSNIPIPKSISNIKDRVSKEETVITVDEMMDKILEVMKGR